MPAGAILGPPGAGKSYWFKKLIELVLAEKIPVHVGSLQDKTAKQPFEYYPEGTVWDQLCDMVRPSDCDPAEGEDLAIASLFDNVSREGLPVNTMHPKRTIDRINKWVKKISRPTVRKKNSDGETVDIVNRMIIFDSLGPLRELLIKHYYILAEVNPLESHGYITIKMADGRDYNLTQMKLYQNVKAHVINLARSIIGLSNLGALVWIIDYPPPVSMFDEKKDENSSAQKKQEDMRKNRTDVKGYIFELLQSFDIEVQFWKENLKGKDRYCGNIKRVPDLDGTEISFDRFGVTRDWLADFFVERGFVEKWITDLKETQRLLGGAKK